jgi:hypothetical protein
MNDNNNSNNYNNIRRCGNMSMGLHSVTFQPTQALDLILAMISTENRESI